MKFSDRSFLVIETKKKKHKVVVDSPDRARLWSKFIRNVIGKPHKSPSFHGSQSSLCTIAADPEEPVESTYL